jgi:hypothetical protein
MKPHVVVSLICGALFLAGCDQKTPPSAQTDKPSTKDEKGASHDEDEDDEPKTKKKKKKTETENEASPLDPFVEKHLAIALDAASCEDDSDAIEPWCLAARGFAKADAPTFPGTTTMIGVATFVQTKGASAATLEKYSQLASLAFRKGDEKSQKFALLSQIKPDGATEVAETHRITKLMFDHFGGKSVTIRVNETMGDYLDGLPDRAKYEVKEQDSGYRIEGGSEADVRKVGKVWVAVEVPKKDPAGIWFSVFSTKAYR